MEISPVKISLHLLRKRHLYTTHRAQRDFGRQLRCNWYTKSRGKSKSRFAKRGVPGHGWGGRGPAELVGCINECA